METLVETTHLVVKQKFEPLEALANAAANAIDMDALGNLGEVANKYEVHDAGNGGDKFRVIEESEYCGLTGRVCCNPNHELKLHVFAPEVSDSQEVFIYDRPCKCGQCCSCCNICQQEMVASDGQGGQFGYIKQPFLGGGFSPKLQVMEREGDEEEYATIESNAFCCIAGLCCDNTFTVKDRDGNEVGKIVKKKPSDLGELATEIVSDADVFAIEFNKELEPEKKATLLGALHLIDYMFFENEGQGNVDLINQQCSFKCCDLYCCGCVCPCTCNCGGGGDGDDGDEDGDEDGGGGDWGGDDGGGDE